MGEVVGMFGDIPEPPEPVASCVDCLRSLLQQAEAGELVGLAYAGITRSGHGQNGMAGVVGGYALLGSIEMAKADLVKLMQEFEV